MKKARVFFVLKKPSYEGWKSFFYYVGLYLEGLSCPELFLLEPVYGGKMCLTLPVRIYSSVETTIPLLSKLVEEGIIEGEYELGE